MKKIIIALATIIGTSSVSIVPAHAGPLSNVYAVKKEKKSLAQSTVKSLTMKGVKALGELEYADAISYFRQAIATTNDPQEKADLREYLFTALATGGQVDANTSPREAIAMLDEAIAMKPDDYRLYTRKGDAYCSMFQRNLCISTYKIAIKLSPNQAGTLTNLAEALVHVDPKLSARVFDLSIKMFEEKGDTKSANLYRWVKSVRLSSGSTVGISPATK